MRSITTGRMKLCKGAYLEYHKTSRIIVNQGRFQFNTKWNATDPFPSLLFLDKNATLIVKDNFSIYSGSRVYVNENATLVLGRGYINNNLNLSCFERIEIGEDLLFPNM